MSPVFWVGVGLVVIGYCGVVVGLGVALGLTFERGE